MNSKNDLINLLAKLYETQGKARTFLSSISGFKSGNITFTDAANENWSNILNEADKRRMIPLLVQYVCNEYPERQIDLMAGMQSWTDPPPLPSSSSHQYQSLSQNREQGLVVQTAAFGLSTSARTQMAPPPPTREQLSREPDEEDKEVFIGRELHWDRILVARKFLNMIKKHEEPPHRVLGIQAPLKEDLDSLVERFVEICKSITLPKPLLYAKIQLRDAFSANWQLARNILDTLRMNAKQSNLETVKRQMERLTNARNNIEKLVADSNKPPTDSDLCDILTDCLEEVTQECIVVLLLPGFEKLRDSKGEYLKSGQWLRDMWIPDRACHVKGLVTLITSESGLDQLAKMQSSEIFCYHPDGTPLPSMKPKDFEEWARVGFGFQDITYEMAEALYDKCDGSPAQFVKFLDIFTSINRLIPHSNQQSSLQSLLKQE